MRILQRIGVGLCCMGLAVFADPATTKTAAMHTRITLNFQSISVRAVLHILADFAHINLLMSDSIKGNMTLRLHDVPWQDALSMILKTQGLVQEHRSGVIFIDKMNPNTPQMDSVLFSLNYAKAVDLAVMLQDKNSRLLSPSGAVGADPRTNVLWLQEIPSRLPMLRQWVRQVDRPNPQVIIEARLVNMSRDGAHDLGVRLGVSKPGVLSGHLEKEPQSSPAPLPDRLNVDLAALPLDASPAAIGLTLARLGSLALLDLELSALESAGRAEIIASPRLMTTNQHAALIESGEDIPYQETSLNGATSVAFKKAVLRLKVTPQITPDGQFLMSLLINQDSDSGRRVQGVPILLTKTLETNVLINNGQTIVLGGIYKQEQTKSIVRLPILGRLPWIGVLFSRHQIRRRKEELLIFITPKLVIS